MEKTKCENCNYYYLEERNGKEDAYGYCCYYNEPIDRVCILGLCKIIDEDNFKKHREIEIRKVAISKK